MSEEKWNTGNGRKEYYDNTLNRMIKLDTPIAFLCYQATQFSKLYNMTRGMIDYGPAVMELSLNDMKTSEKAVRELMEEEE
tara:strand:+ start:1015 stop:1257 length:243 start_codon:yes stop_codon:yes gene_type:complete